ncbi:MAG TPA: hypothetical protein VIE16_04460 [Phenylobacterium sp.]|jgi:hypothetical protein
MAELGLQVMRRSLLLAFGAAALGLAGGLSSAASAGIAADGAPLRVASALDCPASQGELTRIAQAPDGRSCDYRGHAGETVQLRLVPLAGRSASEAMAPTRAALHALLPVYNEPVAADDDGRPGDRADVDLPFFHVHTDGDRADVRMFGVRIHSQGDNADVNVGRGHKHAVVHAGARGAEVSVEDVGRSNASLVYVLASERRTASGYRAVGYLAKGPARGPLVVGEFRSTERRDGRGEGGHNDIDRLIDRNLRD